MLVGVVGARPVADDECGAKGTLRLVTMFHARLKEHHSGFLLRGPSCGEVLRVPE